MSAQPQDGGVVVSPNALGALLLNRGAITEDQLEDALRHQQISGEQLGAILIELGYASSALIAQALATQHGGTLKTEYGFATGFGSALRQEGGPIDEPPVSVYVAPPSAARETTAESSPANPDVGHSALRAEIELASLETRRLADANEQLVGAGTELERRLGREAQRYADLELKLAELQSAAADSQEAAALQATNAQLEDALAQWQSAYRELEHRLAQAGEQVATLQTELVTRDAALEELRISTSATDATHAELVLSLANEVERARSLKEQLVAAEQQHLDLINTTQISGSELEHRLADIEALSTEFEEQIIAGHQLGAVPSISEPTRTGLEQRLHRAKAQLRAAESTRETLTARLAQTSVVSAELEALSAESEALNRAARASEQAIVELEGKLCFAGAEFEQRATRLDTVGCYSDVEPVARAQAHLIFFQGAGGYELIERDGHPPPEGSKVELPTGPTQVVRRVARSPYPDNALPCAYLTPA